MKPEIQKELLQVLRDALKAAGLRSPEDAKRRAMSLFGEYGEGSADQIKSVEDGIVLAAWSEYRKRLRREADPTAEKREEFVQEMRQFPYEVRDRLAEIARKLPHRPGGAPRKLKPEQRRKVPEEVGKLMGQGHSFKNALTLVARHNKVSQRTIERAWQASRLPRPPESD